MKIITTTKEMQLFSQQIHHENKTIGFVPTMGYLHQGHISLIKEAKKNNEIVVASIYVNPTQFGKGEDFEKYPRDVEHDKKLLEMNSVDILFYPSDQEMYPDGFTHLDYYSPLFDILCGKTRIGHFHGVVTIVKKLFDIIKPTHAYFGQKDYQQTIVIKQMVKNLGMPVEIIVCPIVREADGLAMSSRNVYLSKEERVSALSLYHSLVKAKHVIVTGEKNPEMIIEEIKKNILKEENVKIDYIDIVNSETLASVTAVSSGDVIILAVFVGKTRLIDNTII